MWGPQAVVGLDGERDFPFGQDRGTFVVALGNVDDFRNAGYEDRSAIGQHGCAVRIVLSPGWLTFRREDGAARADVSLHHTR